jgi:hypothetical protein
MSTLYTYLDSSKFITKSININSLETTLVHAVDDNYLAHTEQRVSKQSSLDAYKIFFIHQLCGTHNSNAEIADCVLVESEANKN